MLSRFDMIPKRGGQTDGRTKFLQHISTAVLTRDKQVALRSQRGRATFRVFQELASVVQNVERTLLLFVA